MCSPYVVSLCDFAYYVVGYESYVPRHLTIWFVVLVCHQYDVCKIMLAMLVGMVV